MALSPLYLLLALSWILYSWKLVYLSDKLDKCRSLISEFLRRKKVTLKEVQSLTGLLNFACSVVRPGRAFLRRLIDRTVGIRSPEHRIRLNKEVKQDLKLWLSFLCHFNGRSFFLEEQLN